VIRRYGIILQGLTLVTTKGASKEELRQTEKEKLEQAERVGQWKRKKVGK
jgi:hypothetical protein